MRIYLAGPELFLADAGRIAAAKREICAAHGHAGVFPTDPPPASPPASPPVPPLVPPLAGEPEWFRLYLSNEAHARHVAPLVEDTLLPLWISTVSLAEAVVRRALRGRDAVERVVDAIRQIPGLTLVAVEESVAIESAIVRAETRLQLPDAIVIATARLGDAVAIVGNDRRWQRHSLGVPFICLDDLD